MASKFWANASDTASDSSGSESEDDIQVQKKLVSTSKYNLESSSEEEDTKRVVKSAKDKRYDEMRVIIKAMKNHMKINDFVSLLTDYEQLMKSVQRARLLIEKDGHPTFFLRLMVEFDDFIRETFEDRESFKKLNQNKAKAFNTLRSKVRKGNEEFKELLEATRANPEKYVSEDEQSSESDKSADESSESSENESSDDSDSDSDSDADVKKKKKKAPAKKKVAKDSDADESDHTSDSDADDESSDSDDSLWDQSDSDDSDSSSEASVDETMDKHARALLKWGVKKTGDKKDKDEKRKEKPEKEIKIRAKKKEKEVEDKQDAALEEFASSEALSKKLTEVIQMRGRKGTDRASFLKALRRLSAAALRVGPQSQLEVLSHLISALFDSTGGVFVSMSTRLWNEALVESNKVVELIRTNKECSVKSQDVIEDESAADKDRVPTNVCGLTCL